MKERRTPNFFVIGVVKGGTTSLYHYLAQHPEIFLPPIKETNHFARRDVSPADFHPVYAKDVELDLEAYVKGGMKYPVHIAHVNDDAQYEALFSTANGQKAVGEISNSYMICPSAASEIHAFNPSSKLIVMLRNPIYRAWSHFLMNLREAKTMSEDFLIELKSDEEANPKGWGVNHQYLDLGKYSQQLRRYFDYFDGQNILALFYEDYRADPGKSLLEICRFLGIDGSLPFDFSKKSNVSALPRNKTVNKILIESGLLHRAKKLTPKSMRGVFSGILYSKDKIPEMTDTERNWLIDYYREEVNDLADLLDVDLFERWPEFSKHHVSREQPQT